MAQQNNTKVESDSDDDSDESDSGRNESIANSIMRSTMVGTTRTRRGEEPGHAALLKSQTICVPSAKAAAAADATDTQSKSDDDFTAGFAFSFLSEWANDT